MDYEQLPRSALIRLLQEHDASLLGAGRDGIVMAYTGRTAPWQIIRQVKPKLAKIVKKLSVGEEAEQSRNELWDGENLSAMVTLYKYRGQVDLVLTDPPYNTGEDFRYNDKWDKDPNDPDLGELVPKDDGSRHSKWLKFMTPRLWMMKEMLKPGGVLAICIDHRELYRLGMLLDEIFGEDNRLGIINWQKSYAPRNDQKHLSTATEYVLVYAKAIDRVKTRPLPRTEEMNSRYLPPDGDPDLWKPGDLTAPGAATHQGMVYAVQSPFTGELHYPSPGRCWSTEKKKLKKFLEAWGSSYEERQLDDNCVPALVIKKAPLPGEHGFGPENFVLKKALKAATAIREKGVWPQAHWRDGGQGTFGMPKKATAFTNGLYERYAGLNKFEAVFAQALDASGFTWHRNPSAGGFHIPLLSAGDTASFYPDFLVWKGGLVYCLDTKGSHLLTDAVARKLFDIQDGGKTKLHVRFITEGRQTELRGKALKGGFTVWKMKMGSPTPIHVDTLEKAVKECLK